MTVWMWSNALYNHKVKQPQKSNFLSDSTGTCCMEHCNSIKKKPYWVSFAVGDRCILTLRKDKTKLGQTEKARIIVTISNSCLPCGPQNKLEFFTEMTDVWLVFILENSQAFAQAGRSTVSIASTMLNILVITLLWSLFFNVTQWGVFKSVFL